MQDTAAFQTALQPFAKLSQSNLELFSRFSMSPEVSSQVFADSQKLFQQAQESSLKLMQTQAFSGLVQGLMKNYTEFLTDAGQSMAAVLSQTQQSLVQQAQTATSDVVEASQSGARRLRNAA